MLNAGKSSTAEINAAFPDILWCMLGNSVYDITDFDHPGGNWITESCRGRDVGRFMFGGYQIEPLGHDMLGHTHS